MSHQAPGERQLGHFIIDQHDENCPQPQLHLAAYQNDTQAIEQLLSDPHNLHLIHCRVRPFMATPLRLAATAGHTEAVKLLLAHQAQVDAVDAKAQTPLFVALVNQHWECARLLLDAGANPNGDTQNLCSPLAVMTQRGFERGVQLLCQYGADTEDLFRLVTGLPGFPITTAAIYQHLKCFATLLVYGAEPDLGRLHHLRLPDLVRAQCSVPHTIIRYRCGQEFLYLYREFGGDLWVRDGQNRLASDLSNVGGPSLELMKQLQEHPLSLQSLCRLAIRRHVGPHRFGLLKQLPGLTEKLRRFLQFHELLCSTSQLPPEYNVPSLVRLNAVLNAISSTECQRKQSPFTQELRRLSERLSAESMLPQTRASRYNPGISADLRPEAQLAELDGGAEPAPPPPPPPPAPLAPRPGLWRFPEAEFANKVWRR